MTGMNRSINLVQLGALRRAGAAHRAAALGWCGPFGRRGTASARRRPLRRRRAFSHCLLTEAFVLRVQEMRSLAGGAIVRRELVPPRSAPCGRPVCALRPIEGVRRSPVRRVHFELSRWQLQHSGSVLFSCGCVSCSVWRGPTGLWEPAL